MQPTRGFIPHVQQGSGSLFGMFDNPASEVSAHLWLSKGGAWEQYVDLDRRAWAQASGNPYWISVECEGFDTEDYTPIQIQRLAEFYAWGIASFGWRPQVTDDPAGYGIGAHRMGGTAWGGHTCPGDIRANRRPDILRGASGGDVTQDDIKAGALAALAAFFPVAQGQRDGGSALAADLLVDQMTYNVVQAILAELRKVPVPAGSVDPQAIAKAVADELARRMGT